MVKKPSLTVSERMLLHLLDFPKVEQSFEAPFEVSQEGIAKAVSIHRKHFMQNMKKMIDKGLVGEKLAHVAGARQRKTVYFLKWEGTSLAKKIKEELDSVEITLPEGKTTFAELKKKMKKTYGELAGMIDEEHRLIVQAGNEGSEILTAMPEANSNSITPPQHTLQATHPNARAAYSTALPEVKHFFGRERELECMSDILSKKKILVLQGIAGMGKSTLIAKFVANRAPEIRFYYRLREWDSLRNLLCAFSEYFSSLGKPRLAKHLAIPQELDITETSYLILGEFRQGATIVFDDAQNASERIVQFMRALSQAIVEFPGVGMIVSTRSHVPFYDRRLASVDGIVGEMALAGLDEKSALEMVRALHPKCEPGKVFKMTGGHPLALELASDIADMQCSDAMRFVSEEIAKRITTDEAKLCEAISILFSPAELDYLKSIASPKAVDSLVEKGIIRESSKNYEMHDFIREYFISRLSKLELAGLHSNAAKYYVEKQPSKAISHLVEAGEYEEACRLISSRGYELLEDGIEEELMGAIKRLEGRVPPKDAIALTALKQDILASWGRWDILSEYAHQLAIGEMMLEKICGPKYAKVSAKLLAAAWARALDELGASIKTLDEVGDNAGKADVLQTRAWVYRLIGDYEASARDLSECVSIISEGGRSALHELVKVQIRLGEVLSRKGDSKEALDHLQDALRMSREKKDKRSRELAAEALNALGNASFEAGETDKAQEYYSKCVEESERACSKAGAGYGTLKIGQAMLVSGADTRDAWLFLKNACVIFDNIFDEYGIVYSTTSLALATFKEGRADEAARMLEGCFERAKSLDIPEYLGVIAGVLSVIWHELGDDDKSEKWRKVGLGA